MFKNKLKQILKKEGTNDNEKRKIENLVFFVIILIITIVIINYIFGEKNTSNKTVTNSEGTKLATAKNVSQEQYADNSENDLEQRLEEILKNINGVGEVKVFLNYAESSELSAMYNENSKTSVTEETDTSGGTRKIEETDAKKEIVYQDDGNSKTPIIQKTIKPKIEGAIITAKGASSIEIKTNIIEAVEAATRTCNT